jgi:DNA invertase Pin-like site-specific DNA recombinase
MRTAPTSIIIVMSAAIIKPGNCSVCYRSAARPKLQKMLEFIKENQERVDYVIVHKVDRLARNRGDDVDISRVLQEAQVQLVSASESIDNSPSGMLLHGIMSSIAEFYSQNLSTEVKKGLNEKVKRGGTPTKAPIGYRNIRDHDEMGRRDSRIEIDTERAPFITLAFQEYATGNWMLRKLANHLTDLGFTTLATPKLPSVPITNKKLHVILRNTYYKGIITYSGVQYKRRHEVLIDEETWEKVQDILKSHSNGEKVRIHSHYLKSTVYCGSCGERLIIHNATGRSGAKYTYFVCSAKHNKISDCRQRSLQINEIADKVEQLYERIAFTSEFRKSLTEQISAHVAKLTEKSGEEIEQLKLQKEKLEREQRKLLQAHYAGAIPLDLMKEEQDRIGTTLRKNAVKLEAYQSEYTEIMGNINCVFELLDDCGRVYKLADENQRRVFNQAIFEKILVHEDLTLDGEYMPPFDEILKTKTTDFFISGLSLSQVVQRVARNLNSPHPR